MPCDFVSMEEQMRLLREQQLADLERALKDKSAKIAKFGNRVSIEGWQDRGNWCDECAVRRLRQSKDFQVRRIVADAVPVDKKITFGHGH